MSYTYKDIELVSSFYQWRPLLYVTSDLATSGHAANSFHYRGMAVDFGSGIANAAAIEAAHTTRWTQMDMFAAWWYNLPFRKLLVELIHTKNKRGTWPGGWYVKNGNTVGSMFYGASTVADHKNHVHVAVVPEQIGKLVVARIQEGLGGLTVDGVQGPKTTGAIKAFQMNHGLTADALWGSQTMATFREWKGWGPVTS